MVPQEPPRVVQCPSAIAEYACERLEHVYLAGPDLQLTADPGVRERLGQQFHIGQHALGPAALNEHPRPTGLVRADHIQLGVVERQLAGIGRRGRERVGR